MQVEVFCTCKAASFHDDDALDIRGIYERLEVESPSSVVEDFIIALRLQSDELEQGTHRLRIAIISPSGKRQITEERGFELDPDRFPVWICALFQIHDSCPAECGVFRLNLYVDGLMLSARSLKVVQS